MTKLKTCPACLEEKESFSGVAGEGSSYSRYVSVYICSECGVKEAYQGFFWHDHCKKRLLKSSAARRHMSVAELIKT
jgi:hypothetical protein